MLKTELAKKIDLLPDDEYRMVERYVDGIADYSNRKRQDFAWKKIKSDLKESERRMQKEGGITSKQLRKDLGL